MENEAVIKINSIVTIAGYVLRNARTGKFFNGTNFTAEKSDAKMLSVVPSRTFLNHVWSEAAEVLAMTTSSNVIPLSEQSAPAEADGRIVFAREIGQEIGLKIMRGQIDPKDAPALIFSKTDRWEYAIIAALEISTWLIDSVEVEFRMALNRAVLARAQGPSRVS